MNAREAKARELTATLEIHQRKEVWTVPSQSIRGRKYTVTLNFGNPHCTCPDHEFRRVKCKHILAVEYTMCQQRDAQGNETVTETVKVTYRQDWPKYNAAQTQEKHLFQSLLHELCKSVPEPEYTFGRPRLPLRDMAFSCAFKVYSTASCRRFACDLKDAHERGYISKVPHYNSIFNYFENPALLPIMRQLITDSSLPLKAVEEDFAVDATGFSTSRFARWFDAKYGKEMSKHEWVKVHLMCGVKTNVVTAAEVTGPYDNDSPQFAYLIDTTAANFTIREVSADKAYSSTGNLQLVDDLGGVAYIPFKEGTTGASGGLWRKMYHYYEFQREDFLEHYHKRSNMESTVAMIKAKFGDRLRSKTEVAQVNEVLCKVLCHNICVLVQSMHELGIEPIFGAA